MKKSIFTVSTKIMTLLMVLIFLFAGTSFSQEKTSLSTTATKQKSESIAMVFSLVGTVVPLSVFVFRGYNNVTTGWMLLGGSIIGPSLGYFYGGLSRQGFRGVGVRSLCFLSLVAGAAAGWNGNSPVVAYSLIIGGLAGYLISAVSDIVSVHGAVRKHNAEQKIIAFSMAPIIVPQTKTYGFGVQIQF